MQSNTMHLLLKLAWFLLYFVTTNIHPSTSTRSLNHQPQHHHHTQHKKPITFFMQNVLDHTYHWSNPKTTPFNGQLPFQKPLGLLPPNGGIPLPEEPNPTHQTMDPTRIGLPFPALATLQGLKIGSVTTIDEALIQGDDPLFGSSIVGKANGVYVASSDDGSSHMMAMNLMFAGNDFKDGLKFYGVHRTDVLESHIAVIGGTGKYLGANGFAIVKGVNVGSGDENGSVRKFLLFTVYLSY